MNKALSSTLIGAVLALLLIGIGLLSYTTFRPITEFIWFPGEWLVQVSDSLCPPFGVKCVLGSNRQGAHHLWFFMCLLGFWWLVLSCFTFGLLKKYKKQNK